MSFRQMPVALVQRILDRYRASIITWYNFGEPLLHREFVRVAELAKGSHSWISTNFSMPISDEKMRSLGNFERVLVSLSGMNAQTYGLYHRGGDYQLVMKNIMRYADMRPGNASLRWLKHPENRAEHDWAKSLAESIGWEFDAISLNCDVEEQAAGFWHPYVKRWRHTRAQSCRLMRQTVIDPEGNHLLCCQSHNVPLGRSMDDNPSEADLRQLKESHPLCIRCRREGYWRMY